MDNLKSSRWRWLVFLRETTFRSLRHRDYRLYFAGQAVSFTGSWVQSTALMWAVYASTNNPMWPPIILAATVGPTLILGTIGGVLADRFPKRPLIVICQALFLINAAALTTFVWFGTASPWLVLSLSVMNGVVQAFDIPARLAFVPELIPKADLVNAVSLNSLLFNLGRAIGPAVAGLVFLSVGWIFPAESSASEATRIGASCCILLNVLSYSAVLIGLLSMSPILTEKNRKSVRFSDGLRFIWHNKPLATLLMCTCSASFFGWPLLTLFPAYTSTILRQDETEYSWLVSALGAGALVASLLNATFGSQSRARIFLVVGSFLTTLSITGFIITDSLFPAVVFAALFGFGMILYLSTGQSVLQLSTPDDARGRVMALWPMTLSGGAVGGHSLFGFAAKEHPLPIVLGVMAAGVGLTAIVAAWLAWAIPSKREAIIVEQPPD